MHRCIAERILLTALTRVYRLETTTNVVCAWSAGPCGQQKLALSWSGRRDSNPRPQRPERCALTKLRYFPSGGPPFPALSPGEMLADGARTTTLAMRRLSMRVTLRPHP
jgi:hypothetical protein